MRFEWIRVDAGYGKEPAFLRVPDDIKEVFVACVRRTQRIWTERPGPAVRSGRLGCGRPAKKRQASGEPVTVESLVKGFGLGDRTRCVLRDSTCGELRVDLAHRRDRAWDGEEDAPRWWHLTVRREVWSEKTIKHTSSNAPADTPLLRPGPRCRGNATGSNALSRAPKASAAWRTIGPWAGGLGTITSRCDAGDAVHCRAARHPPAGTSIADPARHRRDPCKRPCRASRSARMR